MQLYITWFSNVQVFENHHDQFDETKIKHLIEEDS